MKFVTNVQSYIKRNKMRSAIIAGVVIVAFVFLGQMGEPDAAETPTQALPKVAQSPLSEFVQANATVEGTGEVESVAQVELRSEVSAKVTSIPVAIGQDVAQGAVLATFSNADLVAQRNQAYAQVEAATASALQFEASLEAQEARLAELERGARPEDVNIAQAALDRAIQGETDAQAALLATQEQNVIALENAYQDVADVIRSAYASVSNAVDNQIGSFFTEETIGGTYNPQLTFSVAISSMETDIERRRIRVEDALNDYQRVVEALPAENEAELDQLLTQAINDISTMQQFFDALGPVVEEAVVNDSAKNTYRTAVYSARSSVNTAAVSVTNQRQVIASQKKANETAMVTAQSRANDAQRSRVSAQEQLTLVKAGATQEQLLAQQAAVRQAQAALRAQNAQVSSASAQVALINAQLAKTAIRSPIAGTVASLPIRVGELVSPSALVASVVNTQAFQIKTFIDSADLSLIRSGSMATIEDNVTGTVSNIAPSVDPQTKKVEVTIVIDGADTPLVAGQFVSVRIEPDQELLASGPQAILPLQSVYVTQAGQFVFVIGDDNRIVAIPVELGRVRGTSVEVMSGLDDVEAIVTSVRSLEPGQEVERI